MKLVDVLRHIEDTTRIKVMLFHNGEEVLFEGLVCDIPWSYADMELDTDDIGTAIYLDCVEVENKKTIMPAPVPVLNVYVKED